MLGLGACAALTACSSTEIPAGQDNGLTSGDASVDAAPADDGGGGGGGSLEWFTTCGPPVCEQPDGGGPADAGVCPPAGQTCTTQGQTCAIAPTAGNPCGETVVCDDHDPKLMGCPISSIQYKDNLRYVGDVDRNALHDETMRIRLATYNYKSQVSDPGPSHLGFIIEDNLMSPAADVPNHRVDMYGYFSMIVATMQVQEKEIADLRAELARTKATSNACSTKPER